LVLPLKKCEQKNVNSPGEMGNGKWEMGNGKWEMGNVRPHAYDKDFAKNSRN
jgi:hypothetical protein